MWRWKLDFCVGGETWVFLLQREEPAGGKLVMWGKSGNQGIKFPQHFLHAKSLWRDKTCDWFLRNLVLTWLPFFPITLWISILYHKYFLMHLCVNGELSEQRGIGLPHYWILVLNTKNGKWHGCPGAAGIHSMNGRRSNGKEGTRREHGVCGCWKKLHESFMIGREGAGANTIFLCSLIVLVYILAYFTEL